MFSNSFKSRSQSYLFLAVLSSFFIIGSFIITGCDSTPQDISPSSQNPDFLPPDVPPNSQVSNPPVPQSPSSYPAPHPAMPQMLSNGGSALSHPLFKAINFAGNQDVASIEKFISVLGSSKEWSTMTSEYGVGAAHADTPVRLTEAAPGLIDDSAIQSWLSSKFNDPNRPLGNPDANTIYIIYYPEGTTVTAGNMQSCSSFDGYHDAFRDPNSGISIAYAVIPRCKNFTIDDQTETSTHELIEATLDPDANTGYNSVAQDFAIWETLSFGGEAGDLCQNYPTSRMKPADLGFEIQRTWSNKAAAAGKDPCVPVNSGEVYFNSSPVVSDNVSYSDSGQAVATKGVYVPIGQSKTIELDLYSSGPTSAWSLSAFEPGNTNYLNINFSQPSGVNGDRVGLTISVNAPNPNFNAEPFWIVSTLNGVSHYWPVVVGN